MRPPALLAFLALCLLWALGCDTQRAPRPIGIDSVPAVDSPIAVPDTAQPDTTVLGPILDSIADDPIPPVVVVDTVADTTVTLDTLASIPQDSAPPIVVVDTTVAVESTVVVVVTEPPVGRGFPTGLFHLPLDSLCSDLGYSAAHRNISANLKKDLDTVRRCNGRVTIGMLRSRQQPADRSDGLSVARMLAEIASWDSAAIAKGLKDSTIIGIYVADDITAEEFGPIPQPVRMAMWDTAYGDIRRRWPGAPTIIRATPEAIKPFKMQHVMAGWAQYRGPYRDGPPRAYLAKHVTDAQAQKLGLIIGVNPLNGGCGPPVLPFDGKKNTSCVKDVLGTGLAGTYDTTGKVRRFQMTPAEFRHYKTVFMTDTLSRWVCASLDWQWSPVYTSSSMARANPAWLASVQGIHKRSDFKQAAREVGMTARTHRAAANCIHPDRR